MPAYLARKHIVAAVDTVVIPTGKPFDCPTEVLRAIVFTDGARLEFIPKADAAGNLYVTTVWHKAPRPDPCNENQKPRRASLARSARKAAAVPLTPAG